jgi:hypothetical protein
VTPPLLLTLYALATWRLSSLLCHEDGPADVLKRFRQRTTLGGVLDCVWCCSVWVGLAFAVFGLDGGPLMRLAAGLGFSAVSVIVDRWMEVSYIVVKKASE